MIKTEVSTGCGLATHCMCGQRVCVWVCVCLCLCQGGGEVCNHLTYGELTSAPFAPKDTSSPNCTLTHTHTHTHTQTDTHTPTNTFSWWDVLWRAPPQQRWHKPFSSYLWPSVPYNIHSHTGSWQPTLSLPLYSELDFFSSCLSLPPFFPHLLLSTLLDALVRIKSTSYPRSFSLSLFLCSSLHLCLLSIILSPASFLLLLFYLFHRWLSLPLPLLMPSFFLNILLPLVFLRPLFSAVFTALLSTCSLLLLLFSSATSHPLFSPCLSLSPFLFSQPFSPSLWVSGLCEGSQPPVGHPAGEKSWKANCGTGDGGERKWRKKKGERRGKGMDGNHLCKGDGPNAHLQYKCWLWAVMLTSWDHLIARQFQHHQNLPPFIPSISF